MILLEVEMHELSSTSQIWRFARYRRGTADVLEDKTTAWKVKATTNKEPPNIFRGFEVGTEVRLMF